MKALWGVAGGALAAVVVLAATAGAASAASSGDTCTATGSGTSYQLEIMIPTGAPPQAGFAVGGKLKLMDMTVVGNSGSLQSQSLPPNTTIAEFPPEPIKPGTLTVNVETASSAGGTGAGLFTVVPASAPGQWYDPISCALPPAVTPPSSAFALAAGGAYLPGAAAFVKYVTIHAPGTVRFQEKAAKPLIAAGKVHSAKAGKVMLSLRPTAAGKATLASGNALRVHLIVTFDPVGGKSASRTFSLTLRKS